MAPDGLCSSCRDLSIKRLQSENGYQHLLNVRELPTSARACVLCRLILDEAVQKPTFIGGNDKAAYRTLEEALKGVGIEQDDEVGLRLQMQNALVYCHITFEGTIVAQLGRQPLRVFCNVAQDTEPVLQPVDPTVPRPSGPAVEAGEIPAGRQISEWLELGHLATFVLSRIDQCELHHQLCRKHSSKGGFPLPTRCLKLPDDGSDTVRLIHTAGMTGRYIALSHCWGATQPVQTLASNLDAHSLGMEVKILPKTFRDAIEVTKVLGLQCLWIDSLCIIQDDPDDWKQQAPRMGDVYGNAYLTIAATRAVDCHAGFLGARSKDNIVVLQDEDDGTIHLGRRHLFADDIDDAPLNKRAWVVQERILSQRTLHFTSTQVYWECWTSQIGEDLDALYPGVIKQDAYPNVFALCAPSSNSDHVARNTPRQWWHLLTFYTSCHLTYQKDRLVAITGLMDRISQNTGHKAIAGLFEDVFHAGPLWLACDTDLKPITESNMPSWSWASRQGRINYVQLYSYAFDDDVSIITLYSDTDVKIRAQSRMLLDDFTIGEVENSQDYDSFLRNSIIMQRDSGWLVLDEEHGDSPPWEQISWVVVACNTENLETPDAYRDNSSTSAEDMHTESGSELAEDLKGLVQSVSYGKETPFYCLLVRQRDQLTHERVGIGSVRSLSWLEATKQDIIIC